MPKITIRDVAKKAGVSVATVSRALDPRFKATVKKATSRNILNVVKKIGYLPSPAAKRLATGKSTNIVLFLSTRYSSIFYDDYYTKLQTGIMSVLDSTHYNLTIRMIKHSECHFKLNNLIGGMDIAAAIIFECIDMLEVSREGTRGVGIPVVILNRPTLQKGTYCVACDNYKAAYDATEHLLGLGHRKIAFVKGTEYYQDAIDRFNGYKDALLHRSIGLNASLIVPGDFTEQAGVKAVQRLMAMKDRPTAIFCVNDETAIGAFMGLDAMGFRCPQDVSLIGIDGLDMGNYLIPKLTTMRQPIYEITQDLTREIIHSLENKKSLEGVKSYAMQLIRGGTCGAAPSAAHATVSKKDFYAAAVKR